jgi:FkbH-like protein
MNISGTVDELTQERDELLLQIERLRVENERLRDTSEQIQIRFSRAAGYEESVLIPRLLGPILPNLRLLVLGTCQVDHLAHGASAVGHKADHVLYDSRSLPDILLSLDPAQYDACVVALTLRTILSSDDVEYARDTWTVERAEHTIDQCAALMRDQITLLSDALKSIPTFVFSFLEPSFNYLGNLVATHDVSQPELFVRTINGRLAEIVEKFPAFHYFDINQQFNSVGRMHLQDDVVAHFSHNSVIGNFDDFYDRGRLIAPISNSEVFDVWGRMKTLHRLIFNKLSDNLKIIRREDTVKIIIVDLDDTLWRGVAADELAEGWIRAEGWPLGFIEALLYYKRRGGLLAICSKNESAETIDRFRSIWGTRITPEDFVSVKINWDPKSVNIEKILGEANLLPENALFIDDNPREIDEVRSRFPNLRCLGGNHHDWRRIVLCSPETQVPAISLESRDRTQLVRARIEREISSNKMERGEWLKSLAIEQRYFILQSSADPMFARALELINKTNQFNTTGRRWSHSELDEFFKTGGKCLLTSLKDKTVDNGIVGVTLFRCGEIVQTVLSCRVFGLGAEVGMGSIATGLALDGAKEVKATVVDTGKNLSCHDYFKTIGFSQLDDHYETATPCSIPEWINMAPGNY